MNQLLQQVGQSIRRRALLGPGQRLLVAVSGGVDSMVLLHLLRELSRKAGWQLTVAHLNHQLRGRSSDADERLVRQTAQKLGLPFVAGRARVSRLAKAGKVSLEMAARRARHDFLARVARRHNIETIVLAHHADDQLELFFLRLFRGSGGEGLSGMKWRGSSPSNPKLELVRPLLDVAKVALEKFAKDNAIPFREDASNRQLDIRRNRIRHELLPLLRRKYQPSLDRTILRVMEIAGAEAEFVTLAAARWLSGAKRVPFWRLSVAVQRRCLQLQLLRQNVAGDFDLVERLRTGPGRPVTISPRRQLILTSLGDLRPLKPEPIQAGAGSREVELGRSAGRTGLGPLKIQWRILRGRSSLPGTRREGREFFDADKVGSQVILRHWQPGDRFQPIGMPVTVKLQDLFGNQKIPRSQRHELVVVTNAAGELIWVEKVRISERFKLSKGTKRILQWQWKRF